MRYEARLTKVERGLLAALAGRHLDALATDGWAVEILTPLGILGVEPEEVATPDQEHPHGDVVRPRVEARGKSSLAEHILSRPGMVREVRVISTLVCFSAVVECPQQEILPGVVLPASRGYGHDYCDPEQEPEMMGRSGDDRATVDLDLGFELITEKDVVVVYTRGFFVRVSLGGLPQEEDWVRLGAFSRWTLPGSCSG
jgi:hypothetical protein